MCRCKLKKNCLRTQTPTSHDSSEFIYSQPLHNSRTVANLTLQHSRTSSIHNAPYSSVKDDGILIFSFFPGACSKFGLLFQCLLPDAQRSVPGKAKARLGSEEKRKGTLPLCIRKRITEREAAEFFKGS